MRRVYLIFVAFALAAITILSYGETSFSKGLTGEISGSPMASFLAITIVAIVSLLASYSVFRRNVIEA